MTESREVEVLGEFEAAVEEEEREREGKIPALGLTVKGRHYVLPILESSSPDLKRAVANATLARKPVTWAEDYFLAVLSEDGRKEWDRIREKNGGRNPLSELKMLQMANSAMTSITGMPEGKSESSPD